MFDDRWEVRLAKKAEIKVSKAHKAHGKRKMLRIGHLGHDDLKNKVMSPKPKITET